MAEQEQGVEEDAVQSIVSASGGRCWEDSGAIEALRLAFRAGRKSVAATPAAVVWQRRNLYLLASDPAGKQYQWEACSHREATGHFEREPGYEYRPLYATPDAVNADKAVAENGRFRDRAELLPAIEQWFFRDLGETQRRQLFNWCGFPGVEASGEELQRSLLHELVANLSTPAPDKALPETAVGEPVAWMVQYKDHPPQFIKDDPHESSGDAWTIVPLFTTPAPDDALMPAAVGERCRCCGSADLEWQTAQTIQSSVVQGRLNTNDVQCVFYLGCMSCSETLRTMTVDQVAAMMPKRIIWDLDGYGKFDGVGPHSETIETRARIGEAYLECYESALKDPLLAGYTPADCPSELLFDLLERYQLAATNAGQVEEAISALSKGSFMMSEPSGTPSFPRARKLVIGFENPDHADDAMAAVGVAIRSTRAAIKANGDAS